MVLCYVDARTDDMFTWSQRKFERLVAVHDAPADQGGGRLKELAAERQASMMVALAQDPTWREVEPCRAFQLTWGDWDPLKGEEGGDGGA